LLLLDEPSTGLDRQGAAWLFSILLGLRDSGCTILMSTHRGVEAASLAARAIWLSGGSVVRDLKSAAEIRAALSAEESS
jgi:ABC-2 type transport system ATP-binding protein